MKIGIVGAGTMGHVVKQYIDEMEEQGQDLCCLGMAELMDGGTLEEAFSEIPDVLIDFSHPANIGNVCTYAGTQGIPAVIATTGCGAREEEQIRQAGRQVPIVFSANYSLGITVLDQVVEEMAAVLGSGFDIEIIEKHHNQKIDAPSGTALMIADEIKKELDETPEYVYDRHSVRKKRDKNEIGLHSVRGGNIVGEHTVIFAGNDEIVEITHKAASKEIFALGSIKAAKFLSGKSAGLYNMQDIMNM